MHAVVVTYRSNTMNPIAGITQLTDGFLQWRCRAHQTSLLISFITILFQVIRASNIIIIGLGLQGTLQTALQH